MMKKAIVCGAAAVLAACGMASGQVVNSGEPYNVVFFGSGPGGFVFANPFANTVVGFDGVSEVASGQPASFMGAVGDPVSYQISESVIDNGDGSWTIRVTASTGSNAGFLAPGLDFDPFSDGVQPLDTFTFDLGATTFGTNNGIRLASNDWSLVSANITWLDDGAVFASGDVYQRLEISLGAGGLANLGTGTGLRGQFSVSTPGEDLFAQGNGIDTMVLDMVVVPAPGAAAVAGLGGLALLRRRRR